MLGQGAPLLGALTTQYSQPRAQPAERGAIAGTDLLFTGAAPVIAGAVYGGAPIEALESEGALKVEGDRALAAKFVTLFPLPPEE